MIWLACQKFGVRPPGVKETWEECDVLTQADLIAFCQTQEYNDTEKVSKMFPK